LSHISLRLRERDAVFQAGNDLKPVVVRANEYFGDELGGCHHRCPDVRRAALATETRRQHTGDGERLFVQLDSLADYLWLAAEAPLPETVAQQRNRVRARHALFFRRESATDHCLHAEQRQVAGRHHLQLQTLRRVVRGPVGGGVIEAWDSGEALVLVAQTLEARVRPDRRQHPLHRVGPFTKHFHQPLRLPVWQRTQQQRIDDAENRGVRANAQRQRQDRNRREAEILQQHSRAVAQVLPDVFNPPHTTGVTAPLLRLFHSAESLESRIPRLFRAHSQADILLNLLIQVAPQFIVQFTLDL